VALPPGTRIGPYEILALIGAGGMGEVYRARDTKLNRDVALKVIAPAFALDAERLARFRREAQLLASLNHPHVGAIYGFEDSGETHALVLELVEGETLAARIARGPLPLDEAVALARQIAEALAAAHEQGIIHRDLKPANITITPDGTVKVLDFGLAKLTAPNEPNGPHVATTLSQSPTITSPMMTGIGVVLGTAAYMSPEQAKGREADKRSDIWAFSCVLYEMLTGRRPFDGDDITDVLGAVARLEPDWTALPSDVLPPVRTLLKGCLSKDRRTRVADIAVAVFILDHQAGMAAGTATPPLRRGLLTSLAAWFAATTATGALLAGAAVWGLTRADPRLLVVTTITTSGAEALTMSGADRDLAITPDGSRVVYRGAGQLFVRALNQMQLTTLSGLGEPHGVFISADAQSVGFFDGLSRLARVAITGGSPVQIGRIDGGGPRGATWGPDGTIVFATNLPATGLQRISAAGGEPTVLTTPDREGGERDHLWPEFLPGGKAILFTITYTGGGIENARIAVLDLANGAWKVLLPGGSHAQYVPTGHLVYGAAGTLRAVAFDLERLEVSGAPMPVLEGVATTVQGAADVAIAANGSLVYVPGEAGGGGRHAVVLVDRQGRSSQLPNLPLDSYRDVRVSPNGARLALANENDILTYDITAARVSRVTTDASSRSPLWTRAGSRIIYTSLSAGYPQLFSRPADGSGIAEPLLTRSRNLLSLRATGWSADGTRLLFTEVEADVRSAIGEIAIERPSEVQVLLKNAFFNDSGVVSPNGQWMAYQSTLSGPQSEIYIARYPDLGDRRTISTGGGTRPFWSRNGTELYYGSLDNRQMLAVAIAVSPSLVIGPLASCSTSPYSRFGADRGPTTSCPMDGS